MGFISLFSVFCLKSCNIALSTDPELPVMIKVSGFSFKPIQNFVPNKQINTFQNVGNEGPNVDGDIAGYGPQQFISLRNSRSNNYNSNG